MKHKLLRVLVAVVLVFVLLVSWSPIRANALVLDSAAVAVAVDAMIVVGAALIGLGLLPNISDPDGFNRLVGDGVAALSQSGHVVNGMMSVFNFAQGKFSYAIDTDVIQSLFDWLWSSPVLFLAGDMIGDAVTVTAHDGKTISFRASNIHYAQASYFDASAKTTNKGELWWWFAAGNSVYYNMQGSTSSIAGKIAYVEGTEIRYLWRTYNHDTAFVAPSYGSFSGTTQEAEKSFVASMAAQYLAGEIFTEYGIDLGVVAPSGTQLETELGDYIVIYNPSGVPETGGGSDDDDVPKEIPIIPIPILPTYEETIQLPQEGIWEGNKVEVEAPEPGIGEGGSVAETPWENFKKWISEGWKTIIQAIPTADSIGQSIGNVIKSIFVPDADFISEKWNAIRSRFDFADSISSSGELILDVLNGIDPEPPVIYVDLGDAEGSYYLGGQVAFLDLRWYERYKPTGDAIISAFLWLVFVWRMFIKLPGIIGGLPGDFVMQGVTDLGLADRLPARKKEYENQRQENRRFFKK